MIYNINDCENTDCLRLKDGDGKVLSVGIEESQHADKFSSIKLKLPSTYLIMHECLKI